MSINNIKIEDVKLILKFEFIGKNKLNLYLVSIKSDCIFNPKKRAGYNFCHDGFNRFTIWSTDSFSFERTFLRLPDTNHIKSNMVSTCKYSDDKDRRKILEKLYITLTRWSNTHSSENLKNRVIVDKEYWYVI